MKFFVRQFHRYQHARAGLIFQKDTADGPRSDHQLEFAGYFHKDFYPQPFSTWKKNLKTFYTDQTIFQ